MARVVVVGGGFGGVASAARLAKLGHQVTLFEAAPELGGAMRPEAAEGFTWDGGPDHFLVPAVVRDLFRKSGRPLEKELEIDLEPLPVIREHRFRDRTVVRLPSGRADQIATFEELGAGLGQKWADYTDELGELWTVMRQHYFESPWRPDDLPRELRDIIDRRESLYKKLRRTFKDDRLATVAGHPLVAGGHDLRNAPAWAGVLAYLEQCFGAWRVPGGMAHLRDLLAERLATREVDVVLDTAVSDVVVRGGRAVAVSTPTGEVPADAVVCAVDPRRLPALARFVERTMPAMPPVIAYLGLEGEVPLIEHETVIQGNPLIVIRPGGTAPEGMTAWTVHGRGKISEDCCACWRAPRWTCAIRSWLAWTRLRSTWCASGAAPPRACCGRAAAPRANDSGRPPRSRACTPSVRTRRRGRAWPTWACRPRSWPRSSDQPDALNCRRRSPSPRSPPT